MIRTLRNCAVALLALAAAGTPARADDKVTLKLNLKAGDVWNLAQVMDMTTNIKMSAGGQQENVDQKINMSMGATLNVLEAKDGQPTKSKIKFGDDAKINVTTNGKQQAVPFPLAGKEMTVTKKADGTVDVEPAGIVDADTQGMLSQMTQASAAFYPEKPVGPGDKWQVAGDKIGKMFQMAPGSKGQIECTLNEIKEAAGRKAAAVTFKGGVTGSMKGMDVTLDLSGPLMVDIESGQLLSQDIKAVMTMKGSSNANGQNITIDGTGTINSKQTNTPAK